MVVEILTSEDEHFRNATCKNIEKLFRQIISVTAHLRGMRPTLIAKKDPLMLRTQTFYYFY